MAWRQAKRWGFLAAMLLLMAGAWFSGVGDVLTWEELRGREAEVRDWVAARPVLAAMGFVALYVLIVATALPGALLASVAAGYVFGVWVAVPLVVFSAMAGSVLVFVLARGSLGAWLEEHGGARVARLKKRLGRHAFATLVVLRVLPVTPFFVVNIAAALVGMRLRDYTLATLVGVLPGSVATALAGSGLGEVLARGESLGWQALASPQVLAALVIFGLMAVGVVVWRWRLG